MKWHKTVIILLCILLTLSTHAKSSEALLKDCQSEKTTKAYGYCLGFVTAHLGTVFLQEAKHQTPSYCMGDSMTFEILIGLYIDYYEKHQELNKLPAIRVLEMSLTEHFACK